MVAVVTTYSFDKTTPVRLFNTVEEAQEFLKKDFLQEVNTDMETYDGIIKTGEMRYETQDDDEIYFASMDSDGEYAVIKHLSGNGVKAIMDSTEWRIGNIEQAPMKYALTETIERNTDIILYDTEEEACEALKECFNEKIEECAEGEIDNKYSAWCNDGPHHDNFDWEVIKLNINKDNSKNQK